MNTSETKTTGRAMEAQNQFQFDNYEKAPAQLGPYMTHIYKSDPKHIAFNMARYKFVSKMLAGKKDILEIGCGDGFGLPVVAEVTGFVHAVDWEPLLMEDNQKRLSHVKNCSFSVLNLSESSFEKKCDGVYFLDVLEHVPREQEDAFMKNVCRSMKDDGICIIGIPSLAGEKFASPASREGHINLKDPEEFRSMLDRYFTNHFLFSMNDEMVHTGFAKMAHYLIGMGVGLKK